MIKSILNILRNSPIYPHWLDFYKMHKLNYKFLLEASGDVFEIGAGNCVYKKNTLAKNEKIKTYIASDFSDWDSIFRDAANKQKKLLDKYSDIIFGPPVEKKDLDLDNVNAMDMPEIESEKFDYVFCFEVLEHINNPQKVFSEAYRILKKGGSFITSTPFLLRIHGGDNHDFFRYTIGGLRHLGKNAGFNNIKIVSNTGIGTSIVCLINQHLIISISETNIILKIIFLILSPFVFLFLNLIGFFIDIKPDDRFAVRFHGVFRK